MTSKRSILPFPVHSHQVALEATYDGRPVTVIVSLGAAAPDEESLPAGMVIRRVRLDPASISAVSSGL